MEYVLRPSHRLHSDFCRYTIWANIGFNPPSRQNNCKRNFSIYRIAVNTLEKTANLGKKLKISHQTPKIQEVQCRFLRIIRSSLLYLIDNEKMATGTENLLNTIKCCIEEKKFNDAFCHTISGLKEHPNHIELNTIKGFILRNLNCIHDSIIVFRELSGKHPENFRIMMELAASYRAAGQFNASLATLNEILGTDPKHRGALLGRINNAVQALNVDAALGFADAALAIFPADANMQVRRCTLLRLLGRIRESDACLAQLDGTNKPQRLEQLNIDLALHRFEKAKTAIRVLWQEYPNDAGVAANMIRVIRAAGGLEEATEFAEYVYSTWPNDARLAAALAHCHLGAGNADAARDTVESLPDDIASAPALRAAKVTLAQRAGDYAAADGLFFNRSESATSNIAYIRGRLRIAQAAGWESSIAARILHEVQKSVDDKFAELDPDYIARLNLEIASSVGDWKRVSRLTTTLYEEQPRDLYLLNLRARAAYELGNFVAAERDISAVLQQHPHYPAARKLREALDLVQGSIARYFESRTEKVAAKNQNFLGDHIHLSRDLCMIGEQRLALDCLESCRDFVSGKSQAQLERQLRLYGVQTVELAPQVLDSIETQSTRLKIADDDFCRLFDFDQRAIPTGPELREETLLAWHLCRERRADFWEWRRIAFRASNANNRINRDPRVSRKLDHLIAPIDLSTIAPHVAAGKPVLLVSTHSGPKVLDRLDDLIPDLFYVVQAEAYSLRTPLSGTILSANGEFEKVETEIFRALRKGKSVYSVPDAPIGLMRRSRSATAASGTLFGVPCGIVDTTPKLSRGLGIPSFWVQPVWRDQHIEIEIEQLPSAEPEEDAQAWCNRWAQAYLDKLERLMSSAPENVQLNAPMWRYLLLKGKGRELDLSLAGTAACDTGSAAAMPHGSDRSPRSLNGMA